MAEGAGPEALYTDGSLKKERAGAAIVWQENGVWKSQRDGLGEGKEVFDAELHALREAIWRTLQKDAQGLPPPPIFTDSMSSLQAIQAKRMDLKAVQDIWTLADQFLIGKLHLCWVPSHIGIEGNEEADKAAKTAVQKPAKVRETSLTHLQRRILAYKKKTRIPVEKSISMSKRALAERLLQLRCGHAAIGTWKARFLATSPKCIWCNERTQDTTHLLLHCRKWRKQRKELLQEARKAKVNISLRMNRIDAQKLMKGPIIPHTLRFLQNTLVGRWNNKPRSQAQDRWDIRLLDNET